MFKKVSQWIAGAITLFLLTWGIHQAISLNLFLKENIIEWISASNDPQLLLWLVSILSASFAITLIKLGVKLPPLKAWVEASGHPLFNYLLGLHLGITIVIVVISGIGVAIFQPVCQSPNATIEVTPMDQDAQFKYDGKTVTTEKDTELSLKGMISENAVFFCTWTATGSAISNITPRQPCSAQLDLSHEAGRGIVTLKLSNSSCSLTSRNALEIITVP